MNFIINFFKREKYEPHEFLRESVPAQQLWVDMLRDSRR